MKIQLRLTITIDCQRLSRKGLRKKKEESNFFWQKLKLSKKWIFCFAFKMQKVAKSDLGHVVWIQWWWLIKCITGKSNGKERKKGISAHFVICVDTKVRKSWWRERSKCIWLSWFWWSKLLGMCFGGWLGNEQVRCLRWNWTRRNKKEED